MEPALQNLMKRNPKRQEASEADELHCNIYGMAVKTKNGDGRGYWRGKLNKNEKRRAMSKLEQFSKYMFETIYQEMCGKEDEINAWLESMELRTVCQCEHSKSGNGKSKNRI